VKSRDEERRINLGSAIKNDEMRRGEMGYAIKRWWDEMDLFCLYDEEVVFVAVYMVLIEKSNS